MVWADVQTAGHGRKDREWQSPSGGLYYSFRYPADLLDVCPALQLMGAAQLWAEILGEVTGSDSEFSLKWPNDLLCCGRKIGGVIATAGDWALDLGVGLNINNTFGPDLSGYRRTPISLREFTGEKRSRVKLLNRWLKRFIETVLTGNEKYFSARSIEKNIRTIGRRVKVGEHEGTAVGLHEDGALLLEVDGEVELIYAGDSREVRYL